MGHLKKTASRADAIKRNSERFRELQNRIGKLERTVRENASNERRERLRLDSEFTDKIGDVAYMAEITAGSLEYHLLPWYRRTFDWIKVKLGFDASEDFPEVIDLDFSDDPPDHLDGRPLDLDYKPIEPRPEIEPLSMADIAKASDELAEYSRKRHAADIGQEADGRGEAEPEADKIFVAVDPAKPGSDVSGVVLIPTGKEPETDELRPIRIAAAVELDADPNNLDPELGTPVAITLDDETRDEIEEAGAAIEDAAQPKPEDKLFDPDEILLRMELRQEAETEIASSIMENRALTDDERERLMDQSITRIERIQEQIAHHKLVMCGFTAEDATAFLDARPPIRTEAGGKTPST